MGEEKKRSEDETWGMPTFIGQKMKKMKIWPK